jgi:hypothetical protein
MNHSDSTSNLFIAAPLIFIFAVLAVLNAFLFVRRELLQRIPSSSLVPLIGGIIGCYGFSYAPYPAISTRAWLPLFLDIGSVPWIAYCLWKVYWSERRPK